MLAPGSETGYGTSGTLFDGYVVSGIDFDIDTVSVLSNTTNYSVASLTHGAHSFSLGIRGSSGPGKLVIALTAVPDVTGVPAPATLGLIGLALGLLGIKRRGAAAGQVPQG